MGRGEEGPAGHSVPSVSTIVSCVCTAEFPDLLTTTLKTDWEIAHSTNILRAGTVPRAGIAAGDSTSE